MTPHFWRRCLCDLINSIQHAAFSIIVRLLCISRVMIYKGGGWNILEPCAMLVVGCMENWDWKHLPPFADSQHQAILRDLSQQSTMKMRMEMKMETRNEETLKVNYKTKRQQRNSEKEWKWSDKMELVYSLIIIIVWRANNKWMLCSSIPYDSHLWLRVYFVQLVQCSIQSWHQSLNPDYHSELDAQRLSIHHLLCDK